MHPLVRQAASALTSDKASKMAIETSASDIAPGRYMFQYYAWEFKGGKPRTQLVPVCENAEIRRELSLIMQNAVSAEGPPDIDSAQWDRLAEEHHRLWQAERDSYRQDADALCRFRIESLTKSIAARKNIARQQIRETDSAKIIIMREGEIARLDHELDTKKRIFEEEARLADVYATLLVDGVLIVRG